MNATLAGIAKVAEGHMGEAGPTDTCMSNGLERWCREAGVDGLDTNSVSEGVKRAKAGHNGWKYVEGTHGIARGHFAVWANIGHVTCVTDVRGALWHGVGSGTPSQKVAIQPASGGYNPMSVLQGYLVPPVGAKPAAPVKPAVKPAAVKSGETYTIRKGDTLIRIAAKHDTTWKKIYAANPPASDGKSHDFHILRPNLIYTGQKIRIP